VKLYITHFSPFARMARVVLREKGLADRIEEVFAVTRQADTPYYQINPSGRVPYLVRDDGVGIEGSRPVCQFLDHLAGPPVLEPPEGEAGFEHIRLEEIARSLTDGMSVWIREVGRPREERSATVIEHERQRMNRLTACWESEIDHPLMNGDLNMPQLTLACGLLLDEFYDDLTWRGERPKLEAWADRYKERSSFVETRVHYPLKA
jgi:glutathione S-transferase